MAKGGQGQGECMHACERPSPPTVAPHPIPSQPQPRRVVQTDGAMADFPASHNTATGPPPPASRPYFDIGLAKSIPGMLKIAQIVRQPTSPLSPEAQTIASQRILPD